MSEENESIRELQAEVRRLAEAQRQKSRAQVVVFVAAVVFVAGAAIGQPALTTFAENTAAVASQVNNNFTQVVEYTIPRGGIIFMNGPCPVASLPDGGTRPLFTEVAVGRTIVGRPAGGFSGQTFGAAMGTTPPTHSHTTGAAGGHNHGGATGSFAGWLQGTVNWAVQPGFDSPWHHAHGIPAEGPHVHAVGTASAADVIPYVFYTACQKL